MSTDKEWIKKNVADSVVEPLTGMDKAPARMNE